MATAESPPLAEASSTAAGLGRRWAWAGLAIVLGGGLALRLWGVRQGLPFAYNADEADHFVRHAIGMYEHGTLNPQYFANPPAYTYALHILYGVWYGGAHGAIRAYELHPEAVYTLARVLAALLGTLALWLLYLAGTRLGGRTVGLLAAAIQAVAFLPVFYAHLALGDAPTLAPATLSLLGSAGVLRKGRARDYALAGVGLGLACATKYTAGIVLLPLLAAALTAERRPRAPVGLLLAGACALAAFLIANPYALLDFSRLRSELAHQSSLSAEAQGKLGAPKDGGLVYYLWSLAWGLGLIPALAALAGAVSVWRRERALGWLLVPAALAFLLFMGTEGRYFGRWLLPIFPLVCLLAAFFVVRLAESARAQVAGRPVVGGVAVSLLLAALLWQGLLYSVHSDVVLSRADTRNLARTWMLTHIPAGSKIVAEPVEPEEWANELRSGTETSTSSRRWRLYPALFRRITASGAIAPKYIRPEVGIENYETTLYPQLISFYEQQGFCWVIVASTESGRAYADPHAVPHAIAYYQALARVGEVVYRASPYARGQGPVAFNFDWSFDYYPLAYARPGPGLTIYRLHGGRCARA